MVLYFNKKTFFFHVDGNTTAIIGVTIALGGLLILSLVIGILLYRRHKLKKRKNQFVTTFTENLLNAELYTENIKTKNALI